MTPEHALMDAIRLDCGRRGWICLRCNVGRVMTADGRMFDTGLPVGFPDLLVLTDDGRAMFVETKVRPRKPTADQLAFQAEARRRGFVSGTVYSVDGFRELAGITDGPDRPATP